MPRPKKRGMDMTSFLKRIPMEFPGNQRVTPDEGGVTTLDMLKEVLFKGVSNVTTELKDLKQDFRCFDSRLMQIETKLMGYEKVAQHTQKEVKVLQEEISTIK